MNADSTLAFAATILFLFGGCAVETSTSPSSASESAVSNTVANDANDETIRQESFRLYPAFDAPFGRCDVGTDLVLSLNGDLRIDRDGSVGHASLRQSVPRDCGGVDSDARSYELLYSGEDCGSRIYVASMTSSGEARSVTITDHRGRLCRDRVRAPLTVEETSAAGSTRSLYARDPKEMTCELYGRRYVVGSTFRDECNTCSCTPHGELICTAMSCLEPSS